MFNAKESEIIKSDKIHDNSNSFSIEVKNLKKHFTGKKNLEDVKAVAEPVLSHRILTNFHAESEGVSSSDIIKRMIEETEEDGDLGPADQ